MSNRKDFHGTPLLENLRITPAARMKHVTYEIREIEEAFGKIARVL